MYVKKDDIISANNDEKLKNLENLNNDLDRLNVNINFFLDICKVKLKGRDYDLEFDKITDINNNVKILFQKGTKFKENVQNANKKILDYLGSDTYINDELISEINRELSNIHWQMNNVNQLFGMYNGDALRYLQNEYWSLKEEYNELLIYRNKILNLASVDKNASNLIKNSE